MIDVVIPLHFKCKVVLKYFPLYSSFLKECTFPGITPKVLAKELKELEQHKLIKRIVMDDYPVKITYKTETYADTLAPIIYALKNWVLKHRKKIFNKQ